MARKFKKLSPELEDKACEMILAGHRYQAIAEALGWKDKGSLITYQYNWPEFRQRFRMALMLSGDGILDQFKHLQDDYPDPRAAQVQAQILTQYLKWIDRDRFSDKVNIEVTHVGIADAIREAEARVVNAGVVQLLQPAFKKTEDEDV